jgi:hypothetical protein
MSTGEEIVNFDGAAARGGRIQHTATIGGL